MACFDKSELRLLAMCCGSTHIKNQLCLFFGPTCGPFMFRNMLFVLLLVRLRPRPVSGLFSTCVHLVCVLPLISLSHLYPAVSFSQSQGLIMHKYWPVSTKSSSLSSTNHSQEGVGHMIVTLNNDKAEPDPGSRWQPRCSWSNIHDQYQPFVLRY